MNPLILTDNPTLTLSTNSYMGKLTTLLARHEADPVDSAEQLCNDLIYSRYQTNRNPLVDHPELVNLTFAPSTHSPTLTIARADDVVQFSWLAIRAVDWNTAPHWEQLGLKPSRPRSSPTGQFFVHWTNVTENTFFRLHACKL